MLIIAYVGKGHFKYFILCRQVLLVRGLANAPTHDEWQEANVQLQPGLVRAFLSRLLMKTPDQYRLRLHSQCPPIHYGWVLLASPPTWKDLPAQNKLLKVPFAHVYNDQHIQKQLHAEQAMTIRHQHTNVARGLRPTPYVKTYVRLSDLHTK